ncbi:MAG: hypothetical protein AAF652_18375 [Cyanobacteria bacterium P01_C01_bin.72]
MVQSELPLASSHISYLATGHYLGLVAQVFDKIQLNVNPTKNISRPHSAEEFNTADNIDNNKT